MTPGNDSEVTFLTAHQVVSLESDLEKILWFLLYLNFLLKFYFQYNCIKYYEGTQKRFLASNESAI